MLLHTVVDAISLETLIGLVHRYFDRELASAASDGRTLVPTDPGGGAEFATISDADILRQLLPPSLFESMFRRELEGQYALTFALRHQACYLNVLFHLQSLAYEGITLDYDGIERCFERDVSDDRMSVQKMLVKEYWNASDTAVGLPVIGFSAVGIHVTRRPIGVCRAFDRDEISACQRPAAPIFCKEHASEQWWTGDAHGATTQAKMYAYYGSPRNFADMSMAKLRDLVGRFWVAYHGWRQSFGRNHVAPALEALGFRSLEDFRAAGLDGLRHRYLMQAMATHPDRGGSDADFVNLKQSYEILRSSLELAR